MSHTRERSQRVTVQPAGTEHDTLLANAGTKAKLKRDFHSGRFTALQSPEYAKAALSPFATLTVKVARARRLPKSDWTGKADPYASVYLNDDLQDSSLRIDNTSDPSWNWSVDVPVRRADSILQVQVKDYDALKGDDILGFVEIPLIDLSSDRNAIGGWFALLPAQELQGKAPQRLEKQTATSEHLFGSVYLELSMRNMSGYDADAWYSLVLPEIEFKDYPEKGEARKHQALKAQAIYDSAITLKVAAYDDLIKPCLSLIVHILAWKNVLLTLVLFAMCIAAAQYPQYAGSAFFATPAVIMTFLAVPQVREGVYRNGSNAPLNDHGFAMVAALQSARELTVWLQRVVKAMNGKVLDKERLRDFGFASTTATGGEVVSYKALKKSLRAAAKESKPFVNFSEKALAAGTLVSREGEFGEIMGCKNPQDKPGAMTYVVRMYSNGTPEPAVQSCTEIMFCTGREKFNQNDFNPETDILCAGDDLEVRMSLTWLSNPVVLALIPDFVEEELNELQGQLDSLASTVVGISRVANEIVTWKRCCTAFSITTLFWLLAALFAFHYSTVDLIRAVALHIVSLVVTTVIFLCMAPFILVFARVFQATRKTAAKKDPKKWSNLESAGQDIDVIQDF